MYAYYQCYRGRTRSGYAELYRPDERSLGGTLKWRCSDCDASHSRACTPNTRELASDLVASGRLFTDWRPAASVEAGDYLLALQDGSITEGHLLGEVGQVLSGALPGRVSGNDITIFESLGQAIEDLIAADYVANALG